MLKIGFLVPNAIHVGEIVLAHFVAGAIGYGIRYLQEKMRRRAQRRHIETLFGLSSRFVSVVHSAVFDEERKQLNFPSSDMQAVRVIAHLLEHTGRMEGKDFEVVPAGEFERRQGSIQSGPDVDVIAICGPKRNPVVRSLLGESLPFRYALRLENGKNVLIDRELNNSIEGTENFDNDTKVWRGPGTDYGIIQSTNNPFNSVCRVTVLAGLRGSGTAGVAQALMNPSNLAEICKRGKGNMFEALVKTIWIERPEHISRVSLVR